MKVVVLSSHTNSLFWFRMDMMKAFVEQGHSVVAIGSESEAEWKDKFLENGLEYKQLNVDRNGLNPLHDLKTLLHIYRLLRQIKPDKVFVYQAKTIIYGCIASRLNGIKEVYTLIAGLGSVFRGTGFKNKVLKMILSTQYKIACSFSKKVFFQNRDDQFLFTNGKLVTSEKTIIVNGSGVNLSKFIQSPVPNQPAFLFIGRLIKDKGIIEYLEACRGIKTKHPHVRCLLVGPFDTNPSALKKHELEVYTSAGIVEYFGEQRDVYPYIKESSIFVLPSYHEGTPKTILEAMAVGRAIITTDAPGCRETVIDGINGYLVKPRCIESLLVKMEYLLENPDKVLQMGHKSYEIAQEKYDVNIVNDAIVKYMKLGRSEETNELI